VASLGPRVRDAVRTRHASVADIRSWRAQEAGTTTTTTTKKIISENIQIFLKNSSFFTNKRTPHMEQKQRGFSKKSSDRII
jgi:hypothetical protein